MLCSALLSSWTWWPGGGLALHCILGRDRYSEAQFCSAGAAGLKCSPVVQGLVLENEVLAHQPLLVNGLVQAFTEVKEFLASFSGRHVVMPQCNRPCCASQSGSWGGPQSGRWSTQCGSTVAFATGRIALLDSQEDASRQVARPRLSKSGARCPPGCLLVLQMIGQLTSWQDPCCTR